MLQSSNISQWQRSFWAHIYVMAKNSTSILGLASSLPVSDWVWSGQSYRGKKLKQCRGRWYYNPPDIKILSGLCKNIIGLKFCFLYLHYSSWKPSSLPQVKQYCLGLEDNICIYVCHASLHFGLHVIPRFLNFHMTFKFFRSTQKCHASSFV